MGKKNDLNAMDKYWKETKKKEIQKHKQERAKLLDSALEVSDVAHLRHEIQRYEKLGKFLVFRSSVGKSL
jgi:hypothetical protein